MKRIQNLTRCLELAPVCGIITFATSTHVGKPGNPPPPPPSPACWILPVDVAATGKGARLHCAFQKLESQATREGLWLSSTAEGKWKPNDAREPRQ